MNNNKWQMSEKELADSAGFIQLASGFKGVLESVEKAAHTKLIEYLYEPCPHAATDMGRVCTQYARHACQICMDEVRASS